jgi:hypothetical protein
MGRGLPDQNYKPTITGVNYLNEGQVVEVWADPVSHRLFTSAVVAETTPTDSTKLNASAAIAVSTDGDVTTTTITKTVGTTSYVKTIAMNNVTNAKTISAWSEI